MLPVQVIPEDDGIVLIFAVMRYIFFAMMWLCCTCVYFFDVVIPDVMVGLFLRYVMMV